MFESFHWINFLGNAALEGIEVHVALLPMLWVSMLDTYTATSLEKGKQLRDRG